MSLRTFIAIIGICCSTIAFAAEPLSATRNPSESFMDAFRRLGGAANLNKGNGPSAFEAKKPVALFSASDFKKIPEWPQSWDLRKIFSAFRDERFIPDPTQNNFLRRPSWLYPDDGCYARASVLADRLEQAGASRPAKIFVFGDLQVRTDHSPLGVVQWWYHVVAAIRWQGNVYILDPAVELRQALLLSDWIQRISPSPSHVLMSICGPHSYGPMSSCQGTDPSLDAKAVVDQQSFLNDERARLIELGQNPNSELGDRPSWFFLY